MGRIRCLIRSADLDQRLARLHLAYVAWNIFFLRMGVKALRQKSSDSTRRRPSEDLRSNAFLLVIAILLFDTSVWILATLGNVGSIQHANHVLLGSLGSKESSLRFSFFIVCLMEWVDGNF